MSNILVIEDNDTMREGVIQIISRMGHFVLGVNNGREGIAVTKREKIDFVITDLKMNELNGLQVLEEIKKIDNDIVVMIMTAYGSIELAVEAMKKGAFDFITKPFSQDVLRVKVQKAIELRNMVFENSRLQNMNNYYFEQEEKSYNFNEIVGSSTKIVEIMEMIKKVSKSDSSVFISGESGTGKELVARAIHYNSLRKDKPFIRVNCSALAESLLESELFGHEKGSFTGALKRKLGRFELADTGTIFLDEVGDFSPNIQLKLLRVLQEREFERVGGTQTIKVNVRVISATNKDLMENVKNGLFREDLYYRLHIVPIFIPPLRERRSDIKLLANYFLDKLSNENSKNKKVFSQAAMEKIESYYFPGNIRELENIVEQAYVLSEGDSIVESAIPICIDKNKSKSPFEIIEEGLTLNEALEKLERQMIEAAYEKAKGVKAETARLLGVKTSALYYKLEKYGLI